MSDTRNGRAGQKLISLWVSKSEFDAIKGHCKALGIDRSTFLRLAAVILMERKP